LKKKGRKPSLLSKPQLERRFASRKGPFQSREEAAAKKKPGKKKRKKGKKKEKKEKKNQKNRPKHEKNRSACLRHHATLLVQFKLTLLFSKKNAEKKNSI
jgi:hypothetical protein